MKLTGRPLLLSIFLSIIELALWLSLGVFSANGCENLYVVLIAYVSGSFGEIVIAIATTFYVVFTYRLLANSEVQRRIATEPHLRVRWHQESEITDERWDKMRAFSDYLSEMFNLSAVDESEMATGHRYLILELENPNRTPLGWIKLNVKATLKIPNFDQKQDTELPISGTLHRNNLRIHNSQTLKVTMVDLFPIPQMAMVTLNIEGTAYGAFDGDPPPHDFFGQ